MISGGECGSAGFSSYLDFKRQQRWLKKWMISTIFLIRGHMQAQTVLPLSIFNNELLIVVNNYSLSRILVELCKPCHQCLPFLLLCHYSLSNRMENTTVLKVTEIFVHHHPRWRWPEEGWSHHDFPFDSTLTKKDIWKVWCNIGFIPMNKKFWRISKCDKNLKSEEPMMTQIRN